MGDMIFRSSSVAGSDSERNNQQSQIAQVML